MGILDVLLSWTNRVVILTSVVLLTLTLMSHQTNLPLSRTSMQVTHLLSFSAWFGTSVWVSFIAGIVLIRAVNIDTFGQAQAKLFDAYFKFSFLCLAAAGFSGAGLMTNSLDDNSSEESKAKGTVPFFIAITSVVANLAFVSPQTTITMMERRRVCKDLGVSRKDPHPEVRKLSKRFGMFHGICNLLNLLALGCGVVHACTLATRLDL